MAGCVELGVGRVLVGGGARGPALVVEEFSLYGDLDVEAGTLAGRPVAGRVVLARRHVGSTVGAYVLYGAARAGRAPAAIVVEEVDTVLVSGAVLANVPLVAGVKWGRILEVGVEDGWLVEVSGSGRVCARRPGPGSA